MIARTITFLSLCAFSGALCAASDSYKLEELINSDKAKLNSYFEGNKILAVELDLLLKEIGSEDARSIKTLEAKQFTEKDGFYIEIPTGPYYLEIPNQFIEGDPICRTGLVSAGVAIYSVKSGVTLELHHSCGSSGCGYTLNYRIRPAIEMCKTNLNEMAL